MTLPRLIVLGLAAATAGCSSGTGLSTGSLFGGSATPAAATAAPQQVNDPTTRAFQVGSVSARAVKCGYNFDPLKLRTAFLASESASVSPADLPRVEKVYDTAYNGVAKAIAGQPNYCSSEKTADIKTHLTRHLAGDYAPAPRKPQPKQEGWFADWEGAGSSGPSFGSDDWWSKQQDAVGG